jgi:hypothetical protein
MSSALPPETRERCPLCRKPSAAQHRPFCSRGCRDRDLLNWLGDGYRVPGPPAAPEDFEGSQDRLDSDG